MAVTPLYGRYALGNGPTLKPADLAASFLSPAALDKAGEGVRELASAMGAGGPPLWAGETAAANDGGQSGLTDTFVDSFWYLDQMGLHAASGAVSRFLAGQHVVSGAVSRFLAGQHVVSGAEGRSRSQADDSCWDACGDWS